MPPGSAAGTPLASPVDQAGKSKLPASVVQSAETDDEKWRKIASLADNDSAAALRMIEQFYFGKTRIEKRERLVKELCSENLGRFADLLGQVKEVESHSAARMAVGMEWRQKDPAALAEYAEKQLRGIDRIELLYQAVEGLRGLRKPAEAAALLDKLPISSRRTEYVKDQVGWYAQENFDAAFQWVNSISLDHDRIVAYRELIPLIANRGGIAGLQQFLPKLAEPELRKTCIASIADTYLNKKDLDGACLWIDTLAAEEQGAAKLVVVVRSAAQDIPKWTNYALGIGSGQERAFAIDGICRQMAEKDPAAAGNWALQLPTDVQATALFALVQQWYSSDSAGLLTWIDTLSEGSNRDLALDYVSRKLSASDKEAAYQAAESISDPKKKSERLKQLDGVGGRSRR